ncbi:MAG: flagellar basal body-associated FliL family protein [Deltaproteobacteria bacterium]|nr:flagellar basal body-associated FliL family protein [Deltaproteobacteria bacterium]
MLIGIIAVVVIALGAGGFFFFKGKSGAKHAEEQAAEEAPGHGGGHEASAKSGGSVFNLEPFIVNLQDNSGTRYLKLTINLELAPNTSSAELQAQTAQIRDSLIILLSSKGYADIGTVEGKYQMRDEIVARVNQYLRKGKVKTAYFTEFVIQ